MADQLSPLQSEMRVLVHNVRGSVGIINSSLELLRMEEESETSIKMLSMINRQTLKVLAELELFTERYAPRSGTEERTSVLDAIGYAATSLEIPIELSGDTKDSDELVVPLPQMVLRNIFMALLLRPSPLEGNNTFSLTVTEKSLKVGFAWGPAFESLQRLEWADSVLTRYGCTFHRQGQQAHILFPVNT